MSDRLAHATPYDGFARFYDADYRNYVDDLELILMLAAECGDPILELGCGTGRLLLPLALQGYSVTGIDISDPLLAIARSKLAALTETALRKGVDLHRADMRSFDLPIKDYSFAFCTSNTLMHLADAQDQLATLRNTHRHLRKGGALLLDLFNPDVIRLSEVEGLQELADQWQDEVSGAHVIKWVVRSVDWAQQLQETLFIYEETTADGASRRTVTPFTLRFLWRNEAELMLQAAGFAVESVWGDCEGGDYDAASDHLILLARKE
jgi:SAM-dependent methyltransferase